MKYPNAAARLREKYRRRYANRLTGTGAPDAVIRQKRLEAITKRLRQGVAETIKEQEP